MGFTWERSTPEAQGMSSAALRAMETALAERGTKGLLVARHDRIVWEYYADDHGPHARHYTASLAKALVGGASLMIAMDDGLIDADDRACDYVPQWRDDPLKSKITIRHLATHSSGVENAELSQADREAALKAGKTLTDHHMELPGWKGAFWRREPDPFTISRDDAPVIFEPGSQYDYSNPGIGMLTYAVTASLKEQPHTDVRSLLKSRMMDPIGVPDAEWSCGYGETYDIDGLPLVASWGGGSYSARAVASIARLMLRRGDWEGTQLISAETVERCLAYAGTPVPDRPDRNPAPACSLGWYTNFDGNWADVPRDAIAGAGAGNQIMMASPELDLIVVRNGANISEVGFSWGGVVDYLFDPLLAAVKQ